MSAYSRVKQIGEGSFGKVHLVQDRSSGLKFVMKAINTAKISPKEYSEARHEVAVLSTLRHPNIVAYRESFEEREILYIVMQHCEGGDLFSKIERQNGVLFPEEQILDWFAQLSMAVKYIHDRRILHRDIKSQNVFLTRSSSVKLGDFGISRVLDGTHDFAQTCIGTPYYLSPEICENKPYGYKSDVWSLGCVLYEMATLKHPFLANNIKTLLTKILRGTYPPIASSYSTETKDLIQDLFQRDPKNRPSANCILRKPLILTRCRKLMSEFSFSDFEKSISPPSARTANGVRMSKKKTPALRKQSNSPYIQSIQRAKKHSGSFSSKSSVSSLDPEKIRKAAIRSKEAEKKAIARRQKMINLQAQRSSGTTTESSGWMSSSMDDLTPRPVFENGSSQAQFDDKDANFDMELARERSLSLDSSVATPRPSFLGFSKAEESEGSYSPSVQNARISRRLHSQVEYSRDSVRSVGSAIPFGAPVTSSSPFSQHVYGKSSQAVMMLGKTMDEKSSFSTDSSEILSQDDETVTVHSKANLNQTRIISSQACTLAAGDAPGKLSCSVISNENVSHQNEHDGSGLESLSTKDKDMRSRQSAADPDDRKLIGNTIATARAISARLKSFTVVLPDSNEGNAGQKNNLFASLTKESAGDTGLDNLRDQFREVKSTAKLYDFPDRPLRLPLVGDLLPDQEELNFSLGSPGEISSSRKLLHDESDLDDERLSSALPISSNTCSDTTTLVGSDSEDEETEYWSSKGQVSPFWQLEKRRVELEKIVDPIILKKAYWILSDSLERSEADDAETLQEEVMHHVRDLLGPQNQIHGTKILALVLSDAMHFS